MMLCHFYFLIGNKDRQTVLCQEQQSFAQMNLQEKGKISHRGLATTKLVAFLKSY